jgi:hypothetical protein
MIGLNIKTSDIARQLEDKIKKKLEKDVQSIIKTLGKTAVKHAESLADKQLPGSLKKIYKDNLYMEQISDNMIEVGIRHEALWIEEGRKKGFMDELLKGSNVKTAKDGSKYRPIPFEHSTQVSENASADKKQEVEDLKKFFKSQGIRYSKTRALAMDENGSPRIGRIHSFDIKNMRDGKKKSAQNLSKNLQGVSIYQRENPKTGRVERSIMTFRTISSKHRGEKWEHPGRKGEEILDETLKYVREVWERELFPELKNKYAK